MYHIHESESRHDRGRRQTRERDRCTLEILGLPSLVLGKHCYRNVEARKSGQTTQDVEAEQDLIGESLQADGEAD